jgi:hypothetical protein
MSYHNAQGEALARIDATNAYYDRFTPQGSEVVPRTVIQRGEVDGYVVHIVRDDVWPGDVMETPCFTVYDAVERIHDNDTTMQQRDGGAAPAARCQRVYKEVA